MATLVNSANLTRLILLFSGTALILIGFYGIIEDFIHNWRIEEYSNLAALLSGAAILLATTLVYVIIPDYQSHQRSGTAQGLLYWHILKARSRIFIIILWKGLKES